MSIMSDAFLAMADLNLWYKLQGGEPLMLGDVRELIPLRWNNLRDDWNFIKDGLLAAIEDEEDADSALSQIDDFGKFVETQRYAASSWNPLRDQTTYFRFRDMWNMMSLDAITLTPEELRVVDQATSRVEKFTKADFLDIRRKIIAARDEQSDAIGGTDGDYNRIYSRSPISAQRALTTRDVVGTQFYQDGIYACEYILSNLSSLDTVSVDPFALAKANTNNPDYDIRTAGVGAVARLNYGESLASLATRYLGDPDRWIEIAIANGLKPPYIDEVGQKILLLTNGSANQINLSAVDQFGDSNLDKVYVNQAIFLYSSSYLFPEQRLVQNIKVTPISGEIILELTGELDLDRFTLADGAFIRIFKPNTTNSQFFIMIPQADTAISPTNDDPWFLKTKPEDEKQAGVDLALDTEGDLIFTTGGDLALSYGLANAIQAIQLKMVTEMGTANRNPLYGIVSVAGQKASNEEEAKEILSQSISSAIAADPRFSGISSLVVGTVTNTDGAKAYTVQLIVKLAGTESEIPISFAVNPS